MKNSIFLKDSELVIAKILEFKQNSCKIHNNSAKNRNNNCHIIEIMMSQFLREKRINWKEGNINSLLLWKWNISYLRYCDRNIDVFHRDANQRDKEITKNQGDGSDSVSKFI